jgi:hypothetical protein
MVTRRRLQRLKQAAKRGGVVIERRDGTSAVFSEHAPLALWALEVEEGMEAQEGIKPSEPTTPHGWEALRLREALENATPESRAGYEARYGAMFRWEGGSYDEG